MKFAALFFIILSVLFSWDRVSSASSFAVARYRIDASRSKFIVHANRTGVAWFKGHSHRIAVKDFEGTAELDLSVVNPASSTALRIFWKDRGARAMACTKTTPPGGERVSAADLAGASELFKSQSPSREPPKAEI